MKPYTATTLVVIACFCAAKTQASYISEIEPNNSVSTAQNVDGGFSLDHDPFIQGFRVHNPPNYEFVNTSETIPHVSILGTGNNTFDAYQFRASQNALGIFDIDQSTGGLDGFLYYFDGASLTLLQSTDDNPPGVIDPGSNTERDPFLQVRFPHTGDYVVVIGRYPGFPIVSPSDSLPVLNGSTYTLHISVQDHSVPESGQTATMLILGTMVLLGCRIPARASVA